MTKTIALFPPVLALFLAVATAPAQAACSWSFNWYCSACAKIGGRTTGTQSGYASAEQCESARRSVAREVTTGSCSSSGLCEAPGSGARTGGYGTTPRATPSAQPDFDAEAALRQAEEERQRLEAEEAERRAKEKAEDQRRQRQFMADKLDALNSMKGADFDGARGGELPLKSGNDALPLKSGTPSFGVQPTPGQADPAQPPGESRFSKGTRFSAPVDLSTKDPAGPLRVDAPASRELVPDGALGSLLRTSGWPAPTQALVASAFDDLERGRMQRAADTLAAARQALPQDSFLRRAAERSAQAAKAAPLQFEPERWGRTLPKEAYAAYVVGWEYLQQGNMNGAARMFGRALDAAPKNDTLQLLARETEQRRRILSPAEQRAEDERRARARDYAQGQAALRLGLNAMAWNKPLALNYLDEAGRNLSGLEWEFVRMTRQQIADQSASDPGGYWRYKYKNRGEAMLDALDYGKGDWSASLRYLRHVGQIQKGNAVVNAAYQELERLQNQSNQP